MNSAVNNWRVGLPLAVATAVQWALIPLLIKGLLDDVDAMTLTWCRQVGCALPMALYFLWRQSSWRSLRQLDTLRLAAICVIGLGGNGVLFNYGLQYASPGAAHMMGQLGAVLTLLGGVFIFKETFTRQQWLCALGIVVGLSIFFHDRFTDLMAMTATGIGLTLLAIAPLFWTAYALAQKRLGSRLGPQQVLALAYIVGAFAFLPLSSPSQLAGLDGIGWGQLIAMTLLYMGSYIALGRAMAGWEASRVSAMLTVTPLFTLLFSSIVVRLIPGYMPHEPTDLLSLAGALIVVGSSLMIALPRRRYA